MKSNSGIAMDEQNGPSKKATTTRSFHHDDPPRLPAIATTAIITKDEEKTGTIVEVPLTSYASTGSHNNSSSFLDVPSTASSVQFSLANTTTDSASGILSTGSSSNRSVFTFRSGIGKRSLDLRKLPIDTSLFLTSRISGSKSNKSSSDNSSSSNKPKDDKAAIGDNQQSSSQNQNNSSSTDPEDQQQPPQVMDHSDDTQHDDDDYDDEHANKSKSKSKDRPRKRRRRKPDDNNKKSTSTLKAAPTQESMARWCLRSTCLRSSLSLQSQMLLSFGVVSSLTIGIVMVICIVVSIVSGNKVHELTKDSLHEFSHEMEGKMVRYVAEALNSQLSPDDIVHILHDATVDRFVGYPNHPGYENDTLTPFRDVYTRNNIYPVKGPPALMDWELQPYTVTEENFTEHVQHKRRFNLYRAYKYFTTAAAAYNFPGSCNPEASMGDYDWYRDCTPANNNVTTGGVVHPVATSQHIYERASDLTPLLKAIYETTPNLRDLGICFANDGAGSCIQFPGVSINGTLSYISDGCDWMKSPNPYQPDRPIGTPEMIAKCHARGQIVYNREYNPMERPWCSQQALEPDTVHLVGPFPDAWNEQAQIVLLGQAIYDPLTLEFVACSFFDVTITYVQDTLLKSRVTPNSHVTITRFDDQGTVTASSAWNPTPEHHRPSHDEEADPEFLNDFLSLSNSQEEEEGKSNHKYGKQKNLQFDGPPAIHQLEIGVDQDGYRDFYEMIDYSQVWDPKEVRETYANLIRHDSGYLVAAYPLPPVPEEYNPLYRPHFVVIMSVSTEDVFKPVVRLQDYVDDQVAKLVYFSLVAALVGWGLMLVVIFVVSQTLTMPLKSMNQSTRAIVQNFAGNSERGIAYNAQQYYYHPMLTRCTPETEISHVVTQYEKMVQKFSGSSKMAKAVQERFTELANHFSFEHEFAELYQSRQDGSFAYGFDEVVLPTGNSSSSIITTSTTNSSSTACKKRSNDRHRKRNGAHLIHFGPIVTGSQAHLNPRKKKKKGNLTDVNATLVVKRGHLTSPLFVWIVVFIVTPLLITTITMSAIVTYNVSGELTEVIDSGKMEYVNMEKFSLSAAVTLRASWIAHTTEKSTSDLHVLSRYASWLLFDGLERRDSFTELATGAEECKVGKGSECPYLREVPCECERDPRSGTCLGGFDTFENYAFRYQQEPFFVCESTDTAENGDRNSSLSFPDLSNSPRTTAWWDDVTTVPGNEKGSLAGGYDTTYDRLRVLSAIPVFQTLYNQNSIQRSVLQSAVAMEADGMVVGFHGCAINFAAMPAFWQSTYDNHAHDLRPNLCPIGKFGFDPRCREWYDTGKKLAESKEAELFVAAPYTFEVGNFVGQTCTKPLIDPRTGEHVGQSFVDYRSDPIFDILDPKSTILGDGGYPMLIAVREDLDGANTLVGPGVEAQDGTLDDIEDLVLKNDLGCSEPECERHREEFRAVLNAMESGKTGTGSYSVRMDDGAEETMFIAYAPVKLKSYSPVNSSDFSRGVSESHYTIYYLGLTETETALVSAFDQVEDDINLTIDIGILVLCITIFLATFAVIYISYWVAISIAQPMLYLLGLIRQINDVNDDELLVEFDVAAGSLEVKSVASAMRTLHKIVKCANSAYFAGDIDKAYAVLTDAARLFKRLGNKKAMGVAYNNLGNTMLAMYRTAKGTGAGLYCGLTHTEIVLKGMSYFHESIQLGEKAYDEFYEAEGWSPSCLDFMQHLANRYFNRAMFLLTVKDDHENPKELEGLGMRDLQIARDMDVEIIDQGTEVGWKVNTVEKLYNVALNRARGHLLLLEMGFPDDWDLEELLEELFQSLKKEIKLKLHTSGLFHELSPAGRMQQVETELMRYKVLKGDLATASKIAIRMLMEDEFILPEAQVKAVQVLLSTTEDDISNVHLNRRLALYESWLQRAKGGCDRATASHDGEDGDDISEVVMMSVAKLSMSLSQIETDVAATSEEFRQAKKSSLLATTRGDVTMESFR
ncbi:expressed unknown protein [Seminavis robusta]|uniref:Uncharacterized protein n=1 Tax=Seminavis robusta TaxID=568900 RepID=A0A9N8HDQ1_9STRA|nr:expressed unknown protein [Seminavis robusta]|eukprot:Sro268_g103650.1 n/a (1970) ;mRNA; f:24775-30937